MTTDHSRSTVGFSGARKSKSYRVSDKVKVSSFRSPELVSRWKQYRVTSFVSETFIMSQDCFLNSKDGKAVVHRVT